MVVEKGIKWIQVEERVGFALASQVAATALPKPCHSRYTLTELATFHSFQADTSSLFDLPRHYGGGPAAALQVRGLVAPLASWCRGTLCHQK